MSKKHTYPQEFIELLADNIQALVAYVDTDQRYVFANSTHMKWFGVTPSEILGKRVMDVLGEGNYEIVRQKMTDALAGKKVSYGGDMPLGTGATLHFHADYMPHYNEQGQVVGCFILVQDLDKTTKTEAKLNQYRIHLEKIVDARTAELIKTVKKVESEKAKSEAILAAIGDGISIQDRDFKILYQNAVQKDFTGDHEGDFCYRALANQEKVCSCCPVEMSFRDGKIHKHERTALDKPEVTYEITSSPLKDSAGNIIAGIEVSRDISERKKVAASLEKANLELAQILNTVESGIALIDTDKNILRVNQAMLAMSHLSEEEVLGHKCHDLFQITACGTDACPLQRILAGASVVRMEGERKCLDGSSFPCEVTAKPLLDSAGELIGMVEDVRDLTEKKKLEAESALLLKQAIHSEKLASLGMVVAGVAHEINNPNSFISYNAPMAEKIWQGVKPVLDEYAASNPQWRVGHFSYQEVTESMAETLEFIKTGSERINGIVNSLKEFSGHDKEQDDAFIQVNTIINQAYTIIGAQIRKKVGTIAINLADNLPETYGQFQRVEQVIVNLMLNAMDAVADKKSGRISVTTKYNERLQAIVITVEDNGKGIEKDVMDLIFDPFFTTRRDQGGTGLGLSVSFGLIKEHNGTISVLSLPGQGTSFTVYLPLDKREQKKVVIEPTVLCIDDDPNILQLIETFFKRSSDDISITSLNNPDHVLTYLDEHPEIYLIISDIMMPEMNGWELLAKVKTKYPLMPIALISGQPKALEQPEGAPTPDHIASKPLSLQEISTLINKIDRRMV